MASQPTRFGSLQHYERGGVEIIKDDPRNYVFSNVFEVAMPADIRHRGFSPTRSMLLVWENASPELPALYASGKMPPAPVQF